MIDRLRQNKILQLIIGFVIGIFFGFLLQKGGVTDYDVIISQLLLEDFTVLKVMLSAVLSGMVGVYILSNMGLVHLHPKAGSFGATVPGGLIFGVGFGILGYCPGTLMGAIGQGSLDALCGGVAGILLGTAVFASIYSNLNTHVLHKGDFGELTLPQLLKVNPWVLIIPASIILLVLLTALERLGF